MKGLQFGFLGEACFTLCPRERSLGRNCWWSLLTTFVIFGSATLSFAQAPGWSRGQQDLAISYDDCLRRASAALTAEGHRIDYAAGNFAVGITGVHTSVIICNPLAAVRNAVNIVVASNGEGGGALRERLQARMSGIQPPAPGGGGGGAGGNTGGGGGGGPGVTCPGTAGYAVTIEPNVVQPGKPFTVTITVPDSNPAEGSWFTIYKGGLYRGGYDYLAALKPSFRKTFLATDGPGQYEVRVFLDSGYTNVAVRCSFTVLGGGGAGSQRLPAPGPIVARGCQGSALTLALSSDNIRTGQQVAARVTVPGDNPPTGSWIGLFPINSTNYIAWQYLADLNQSNFSRNFTIQRPGEYEIRTYLDAGYDKVASRCYVTVQ